VKKGRCVLIDVRKQEELRAERTEGAKNVPVDIMRTSMEQMDRDTPLPVYCKGGKGCRQGVEQLREMRFHEPDGSSRRHRILEGLRQEMITSLRGLSFIIFNYCYSGVFL